MSVSDLIHRAPVRYLPAAGLSTLFRPLAKGAKRPVLNVGYQMANGGTLHFSAREALGVPEQTLLLAILQLAGEQYASLGQVATVGAHDHRELPSRLWSQMYPGNSHDDRASMPSTVMVRTTWKTLNQRCGSKSDGGSITAMRRACLQRLCEVVVWEEDQGRKRTRQSFLLVWVESDDRHVHLALNHRLASVFFDGQYAKLWMQERLRLPSDLAMLVHAFLSTTIRPSKKLTIGLDKLAERVWPLDHATAPQGTRRYRLSQLRQALRAMGRLGHWTVLLHVRRDMAEVQRTETHKAQHVLKTESPQSTENLPSPHSQSTSTTQDALPGNVSALFSI